MLELQENINIKKLIYDIRDKKVMLDSDVAVKANIKIVNEFIEMKKLLYKNNNIYLVNDIYEMKHKLLEHGEMIIELFFKFDKKEDFKNK